MIPTPWSKSMVADPGDAPIRDGRMRPLSARLALEALALIVVGFGGGIAIGRAVKAAGWPRLGGYLGMGVIAVVLGYVLAVYAYRWTPRAAWRRALLSGACLTAALAAGDLIRLVRR